jgi:phosphoglycerol transferase
LDEIEKKNLLLVGDIKEHLLHAKLIVDSPNASIQVIKPDEKYFQIDTKYANIENILVIGPHSIVSDKYNVINLNGFKFVKKINGISLDFRSPFNPFIISNISGISASEAWGAWSIGEEVEIEFASNLPSSFKLKMTAKAFNNNVGKDIIVQVGDVLKAIQLSDHLSDVSLDFHDLKPVNEIKILVPAPTSPHEIGMNADERKIGIGFLSLSIEPSK